MQRARFRSSLDAHVSGRPRRELWPDGLLLILVVGCVVVPCVFTTRLQAVFVVPKLAVLWALLALSLALVAGAALVTSTFPGAARPVAVVDIAVVAFIALTIAAWAFSSDHEQSLYGERLFHQGLLTTLLYIGFFYVARLAVFDAVRLWVVLGAASIGATLVAGYGLAQEAGLDPVWEGFLPGGRVFSSIGQSNWLAAYLVLALPISASFLFARRPWARVAAAAATLAIGAAFIFAQSRGGYLGLAAAITVLAVGWRHEVPRRGGRVVLVLALALAIAVAALSGNLGRITSADNSSARFHIDAWHVAVEMIQEQPLLGSGPETYPNVFPSYSHRVLPADRAAALDAFRVESPHNVYLAIAAGNGVPALVAYLIAVGGFVALVLRAIRRAERRVAVVLVAVLAAVTGHLVTDAFMTAEVTSSWLSWVLMGATIGSVTAGTRGSRDPG